MLLAIVVLLLASAAGENSRSTCNAASPGTSCATNDYPAEALRNKWQGTAEFTVTVGTDGRASDCVITKSTGYAILDAATCAKITARARFKPALGPDGQPILGKWSGKLKWQLPE